MRRNRLPVFVVLVSLTGACATAGGIPEPFPTPARRPAPPPPAAPVATAGTLPSDGYSITGTALSLRGIPYRNGGSDPRGFDCSGFVEYVFGRHGISVPRTVGELYRSGASVDRDAVQAGDLLFFSTTGPGVSHVGMAIGGDEFVHAPSSAGVVRVERFSGSYWFPRFVGARRLY